MAGHLSYEEWLRPKWRCPHCGSVDILVARPAWVRELSDGTHERHVEVLTDAAVIQWYCCHCERGRSGEPERNI